MISHAIPLLSVQTPLPFLNHTKLIPNSEPLHLLFPSLEYHSSKCYTEISLSGVTVHQPPVVLTPGLLYCLPTTYCHWKSTFMFVHAGFCYSLLHAQACSR